MNLQKLQIIKENTEILTATELKVAERLVKELGKFKKYADSHGIVVK